jgi:hypothetical protein
MPNPLTSVACADDYTDAATITAIYKGRGGFIIVENAAAIAELEFGGLGTLAHDDAVTLQPGGYAIEAGATGVRFKNAAAGTTSTVSAKIIPNGRPGIGLAFAGTVGSTMLTGSVASNGAINGGSGFTVNRTGVGVYVVSATLAFSSAPVVVASLLVASGANTQSGVVLIDAVSGAGFTARTYNVGEPAGVARFDVADLAWNFIAQAVQ